MRVLICAQLHVDVLCVLAIVPNSTTDLELGRGAEGLGLGLSLFSDDIFRTWMDDRNAEYSLAVAPRDWCRRLYENASMIDKILAGPGTGIVGMWPWQKLSNRRRPKLKGALRTVTMTAWWLAFLGFYRVGMFTKKDLDILYSFKKKKKEWNTFIWNLRKTPNKSQCLFVFVFFVIFRNVCYGSVSKSVDQ